jgi:hypothetical protein
MFEHRLGDPIDFGVVSDGVVLRVDQNHFIKFVSTILTYPIGVKDSETAKFSSDSFFGKRSQISLPFKLDHSLRGWFTVNDTLLKRK